MHFTTPLIGHHQLSQGGILGAIMPFGRSNVGIIVDAVSALNPQQFQCCESGYDITCVDNAQDGRPNTRNLLALGISAPAAKHCAELQTAGFSDWYLPSLAEMLMLRLNVPHLMLDSDLYWTSTLTDDGRAYAVHFGQRFALSTTVDTERYCHVVAVRRYRLP
ncbi:hypothetical protein WAE61_18200 [Comamonadaceae bacterium PP-2]